jgi:hypothetical protein
MPVGVKGSKTKVLHINRKVAIIYLKGRGHDNFPNFLYILVQKLTNLMPVKSDLYVVSSDTFAESRVCLSTSADRNFFLVSIWL